MRIPRLAFPAVVVATMACDAVEPSVAEQASALAAPGVITVPGDRASPLAPFEVKVADADANVDPDRPDAVFVYVWTDAAPAQVRFVLEETGASTGQFEGDVGLPAGTPVGQNAYVAYRDANVGGQACGSLILPPKVLPVNTKVDLVMEKLEFVDPATNLPLGVQTTRFAGESTRIHIVLRNDAGAAYTAGWSRMPLYFVGPGEYDDEVDARPIGPSGYPGYSIPALAPGATYDFYYDYTIPYGIGGPWIVSAGAYIFYDDGYGDMESSYANNLLELPVTVTPADLTVSALTFEWTGPRTFTATAEVKNGDQAGIAAASTLSLRLIGPEARDDEGYPYNPEWNVGVASIGVLPPGETQTFTSAPFTIDPSIHGACVLTAHADSGSALGEASEANNARVFHFTCP